MQSTKTKILFETFECGPYGTNAFFIGCDETKECILIDPSPGSGRQLIASTQKHGCKTLGIFLTHSHWDHIVDAAFVKKYLETKVYVHEDDKGNLINPGSDGLPNMVEIPKVEPDHFIKDGDKFTVGNVSFEVIGTPGHTPGGVCFYFESEKMLISGDTLYKGSIGNLTFPTAEPQRMWPSLKRLAQLPEDTIVYTGHGASTTIGDEKVMLESAEEYFG